MAATGAGFDTGRIYTTSVLAPSASAGSGAGPSRTQLADAFYDFLQDFRLGSSYIYRDQLRANLLIKIYALDVDFGHLISYNEELAHALQQSPAELLELFEVAVQRSARKIIFANPDTSKEVPACQVTLRSSASIVHFRDLHAESISRLVRVPGIIISASTLSSRATHLHLTCKTCRHNKTVPVASGFAQLQLPRVCDGPRTEGQPKDCPLDPYVVVHDKCKFVDQQTLKLQEAPDTVPVGELPRHIMLSVDRYLTAKVIPGSRVTVTGIYSTFSSTKNNKSNTSGTIAVRTPYIRVVGLEVSTDGIARGVQQFTDEEEEEFAAMARSPNFYETFSNSIAPSIYGNLDIKKAVTCLLFGGSKKILPDGMRLRGDINVLLLGDPGTAKSQLLKFVEKVSPIAVYTSGKGSSAAGLTASVQRDATSGDFYLEGGAMVLADGGVVCIDEFDKMRDEDRVAIHEAMEQQTISIAKAGITTILNSRTSVLAAANPIFGRYDDMRTPGENIDFQTTILSRFDMIFIVKDEHDEQRDRTLARHVMNIHMNRSTESEVVGEIDIEKMKRYIAYCKARCAPRLSVEAAEKLSSHYVSIRKQTAQIELDNDERSSIPITVRQLEAIARISESLAKVTLSPVATEAHVDEAIRLFKFSTMDAVNSGTGGAEGMTRNELQQEIEKIEGSIKRRLPLGWTTSMANLSREFVSGQGYSAHALERALWVMERRDVIAFTAQRKSIRRIGM